MVALLPDRGKLAAWLALLTTLVTFGLTLHLPAHFVAGQPGFQFEINRKWIELGAAGQGIFYHVGVDGLSLWLVVLSGLLATGRRTGKLERDQGAQEGLLFAVPGAADGDDRRIYCRST